ncbi:hypothetical protein LV457_03275 [Mycobacterium sp. MYCO198283]|uniref:hypothetical protein n=1 Tax=Mycobacterium sp. MYCO198283 TaxID=2883505 RepID=UPI001E38E269|nr:hypothetical protein [Mycobacterium sp. MYCO198283]MCG5431311.1 hypothetical protein [Mycobacterium sp. MYCO198283]
MTPGPAVPSRRLARLLRYAASPRRLLLQLISDAVVVVWTFGWLTIGMAVHAAVSAIAEVGRQVESGADGIGGNLDSAGERANGVPWIGDDLSKPLEAAGRAARDLADAGHQLDTTASWLAVVLAIAVAAPPILGVAVPWLYLRLRFFRRKRTVIDLAATPAGRQLLALRALANRPLRTLTRIDPDPVSAWRRDDPAIVGGLAALELRSAGLRR